MVEWRRALKGPTPPKNPAPPPSVRFRERYRPAWAEVDLDALRANAATLRRVAGGANLCAVVKADGYGHGAVPAAKAALAGGAVGLAVALVEEGIELRDARLSCPILLLSEPAEGTMDAAVAGGVTPTIATPRGVEAASASARALGRRLSVHVKVDTGMHRVGAAPEDVLGLAKAIEADPALQLEGLWTHLAVADGGSTEDRLFTVEQIGCFDRVVAELAAAGIRPPVLHAANSAGTLVWPEARYQMVRTGIALYGEMPSAAVAAALQSAAPAVTPVDPSAAPPPLLQPVMSLKARVTAVRELPAGARPSYGRHRPLPDRSVVATVPLGYADGLPRALFEADFHVLIGGRRRPLAGMVTMDQIVVDCGSDRTVVVGDEVVLLGRQGDQRISVDEWAGHLGVIGYEVLCGIGPRVPRIYSGMGSASEEEQP